ncbi:MAG: beta-ketoacyl synthase N-terminal-like domain-containing protein [Planctomycetota bacterium]|nr:beta-ketoacyl synthase N-terminal-like domain-containing protein [Planctomycetota bacterium]
MTASSPQRRIVISGMGLISPLGDTPQLLWDHLASGKSGVQAYDAMQGCSGGPSFAAIAEAFSGKVDDFGELQKDQKKMIRKGLKLMSRETQMGVAAAQLALQDAGFLPGVMEPERCGCIFGTDYMLTMPEDFADGIAACESSEPSEAGEAAKFLFSQWGQEGLSKMTPLWLLRYLPNMPASHVAIYNDLRGPNNSLTMREAAANLALGEAFFTMERGSADLMVVGATGTRVHPMNAIHAVQQEEVAVDQFAAERLSRPFDRDRCGMVLGEGAGVVVLEELKSAEARGATIYGEILARGSSTVLSPQGVADREAAIRNALGSLFESPSVSVEDVGHIHAHGLSTRIGDMEEARAVGSVFDGCSLPVMAAKGHFGNLGAGSGMVELISSLRAVAAGQVPAMMNFETPDPDCSLPGISREAQECGDVFINLSVTPQAQAAAVAVGQLQ